MSKLSKVVENHIKDSDLLAEKSTANNIAVILDALNINKGSITINEDLVEMLGASGVSVKNACSLLRKGFDYFTLNPTMQAAFERGRANLGSRVRSKLIEAALDNGNIQSAIHLDKIYSGDTVATEVNLNVSSTLTAVSDEDLLKVAFNVEGDLSDDVDSLGDGEDHSGGDSEANGESNSDSSINPQ